MHILLTRQLDDCYEMILKLKNLGHKVSHLPTLNVEKIKYEKINYSEYSGIIFTSTNAIKFLDHSEISKNINCFCVGKITEKKARSLGFHNTIFFTWGSVIIVGLLSNFFNRSIMFRILGVLTGVMFFYLITNFGVWLGGMYGSSFNGLITSYIMGLPFLGYNLISTFIFSALIESFYKFYKVKVKNI